MLQPEEHSKHITNVCCHFQANKKMTQAFYQIFFRTRNRFEDANHSVADVRRIPTRFPDIVWAVIPLNILFLRFRCNGNEETLEPDLRPREGWKIISFVSICEA